MADRAELRDHAGQHDDRRVGLVLLDPRVAQRLDLVARTGQPHHPRAMQRALVVDVPLGQGERELGTQAHARTRPSWVMVTFSVAMSLEPASNSAPVHFDGQPAVKFQRATSSNFEFFATIEPSRRAVSMSPSMTCLRHSHSAREPSMRRSSEMSDHFMAPGTLRMIMRPSLVASLYSMVSVSDSIPEHLRKLPISTLSISSTKMKLGVRSGMSYLSSLGGARAALPLADPEDDELRGLDRGDAHIDHELAFVH